MTTEKIAVVTGSNKGIGFAIVKGLCERFKGKVYLTSRDVTRGKEAVKKLNDSGLNPLFHQLDINDQESVDKFAQHLKKEHGGIDILVNNAAILFLEKSDVPIEKQAEDTIAVNYFSTLRVCDALFPLLRQNGRVVNLSSAAGHLCRIPSEELRKKLSAPTLTVESLSELMKKFVSDVKAGKHVDEGWGTLNYTPYIVSKVGISSLTIIQQKEFDEEIPNRNISVNSVHPGFIDTDMVNHMGPWTIEQGAAAPLFLALDDHGLRGKYVWSDKNPLDWYADSAPLY